MNTFYSKTGNGTDELAYYFRKSSVLVQVDFDMGGWWSGAKSKDDTVFNWYVIEKGKIFPEDSCNLYMGKALVRENKVISIDVYDIGNNHHRHCVSSKTEQDGINKIIKDNIEGLLAD
jgi:hypothetical protein